MNTHVRGSQQKPELLAMPFELHPVAMLVVDCHGKQHQCRCRYNNKCGCSCAAAVVVKGCCLELGHGTCSREAKVRVEHAFIRRMQAIPTLTFLRDDTGGKKYDSRG